MVNVIVAVMSITTFVIELHQQLYFSSDSQNATLVTCIAWIVVLKVHFLISKACTKHKTPGFLEAAHRNC